MNPDMVKKILEDIERENAQYNIPNVYKSHPDDILWNAIYPDHPEPIKVKVVVHDSGTILVPVENNKTD